jgi:hypothetical protein
VPCPRRPCRRLRGLAARHFAVRQSSRHQLFHKPIPATVWAAGALASIINWFASALIVIFLLDAGIIKPAVLWRVFWGCWSFWFLGELFNEVRHAYAPPSVWEDSTQFVCVTGINPHFIGLPLAAVFVIGLYIGGRILKRLWG